MSANLILPTFLVALAFLATNPGGASVTASCLVGGRYSTVSGSDRVATAPEDSFFIEIKKLTATDNAAGDGFGTSVAVSGDTVVIGARGGVFLNGAVYIFERNRGGADRWGQVKKLTALDGLAGDQFGLSIGISGNTVVVGAYGDDFSRGAAYIFDRNRGGTDNWGQVKKLTASDGVASDLFGFSVGISGDTVVVGATGDNGARGSAYVFERSRGGLDNWGEARRLSASDASEFDLFGYDVRINDDTVVVGAFSDDVERGSAYIYERNRGGPGNWGEVKKLTASDGTVNDQFGVSVGISGNTVVVAANGDDSFKGSAYVFERNNGGTENWGEVRKLTASDGSVSGGFGRSVGISGDTIVVGANGDASFRGSSYVFERNKGGADNWGEVRKLIASDGVAGDQFGSAVGINLGTIAVGARGDDESKGSAYIVGDFPEAVSVSAANYQRTALAPEIVAAAFGVGLATGIDVAGTIPLPTNLRGTTVSVRDSAGSERPAQLFFVSPGQINYQIPAGTAMGPATVKITSGIGQTSLSMVTIAAISPGFFSANSTGQGIAAALALRVRGAQQIFEQISRYDPGTNSFVPIPVDLGPAGDQVFLVMFGTGFRFRSSESGVSVKVGGRTLQSLFSGPVGGFVGLDQMNISPLPRELAGAGVVNIEITVDGKPANTTTVSIK